MKKVELVSGISSSVLGFGCAPILGSKNSKESRRALEMAFSYGITHFDLARSYGYGEAESFVGKVLGSNRSKLIYVSKFGIKANWKAKIFSPVKPIIRLLKNKNTPQIVSEKNGKQNAIGDLFHDRVLVNAEQMKINLLNSLKSLKTDFLDYYLIHEPLQTIENIDELCEMALRLKEEGKIRAWGLAFYKNQKFFHESYLNCFDILQFNNSPVEIDYLDILTERSESPNILFSPIRGASNIMTPNQKLEKLLNDFSKSVILCSMFSEKHLIDNVRLASQI